MSDVRRADAPVSRLQRRTLTVLVVVQVLAGIGVASAVSVGALVAADVLDRRDLAGLVQTSQVLGAAALALPAARVSARYGRGAGLATGLLCGAVGAALAAVATTIGPVGLLLLGSVLLGGGTAAGLQARFAGTDLARPEERARALSVVVWATTIGAVLGPNLLGPASAWARGLGIPALAGPYLVAATALAGAGVVVAAGLRPDPLRAARGLLDTAVALPTSLRRGLSLARRSPTIALGMATVAVAHAVMVGVMVITPIHMNDGGATITVIGLVISGHVAGMYALSPVMGWLADRVGRRAVLLGGAVTLTVSAGLAAMSAPGSSAALTVGLVLLGLGWSACLVAGSAMVADASAVSDRPSVQGTADTVMSLSGAAAGALAGVVVTVAGFTVLGWTAALLAASLFVVLILVMPGGPARAVPGS